MMSPLVTVAILTYNRERFLKETLAALARQNYPIDQWELLVIDNNSTDNTRSVVESFSNARPSPRYLLETKQGLDHGRNRAIAEARGQYIVLADDDILMEPTWLRELVSPLVADAEHKIGVVGGEVVPVFPDGLPPWMSDAHTPLDYRNDAGPLPAHQLPMGANFAFPRWVFDRHGQFHTDLDRQGTKLFGGGDAEIIRRLRAAGLEVWFVPAAKVFHQIPSSRLTFGYATRHAFDSARSRVVDRVKSDRASGASPASYLLSRAFGNVLKVIGFIVLALLNFVVLRFGSAKKALVRAWRSCGYLYQITRSSRGKL